ncbi:hypothetical protein HMI55_001803 [Coelomomyces lativittatus]|nr:hypothetical protein HMI55_001803 [Coelomomyces lativittatus]
MTISSSSTQEEDLLPGLTPPSHSPSFRFTPAIHNPKINGNSGIHEDHVNENENEDKNSVTMEIDTNQADDPSDEETPMEVDSDHEGNIPQSTTPVPSTPIQTTPFPLTSLNFTPTPFNQKRLSIGTLTKPQPLDTAHYLSAASQALLEERKGPLQRLVITYMVLENFKSYAGTQKIGPFHKSFTAVVGANGSGKSNIIDALLFVFGYRANKLRQSKLGHLIHHSDKFPDLSQCTVSVLFQEILEYPDGVTTIVPNSEFSISRTAFRNHSSKYAINKETQPFSEVVDLLKSKQVDLDNHRFLILQGEVESIAQMKAKAPNEHEDGLLEYLEDIIGTGHYKVPIAAKLLELDEVNEQRNEKLARAVFVEQEKKRLEASKLQAEQFLQKEQVCHHHEAWLVHVRTDQLKERAEESQEKLTKVVEAMKELESKFETMSSDHLQLEEEMKQAQKDLQISQQQIQEIEKKSSTMATEDVKVREIQKSLKRKIEKVEKSIDKHMFTIAEQERWLTNDAKDAEKFQLELTSLHKQHEVNVQTLEKMDLELRFKTHDVQVQLDQLKTKRLPLHSEWQQKKGDLELVQSEMEAFFEQKHKMKNERFLNL